MKIRELQYQSASAVTAAWPPQWSGWGGGPWPIATQGTILRVEWGEERRSLRIINRFEGREYQGTLLVDDPETVLRNVLDVLNAHIPVSVEEAGGLDLPDPGAREKLFQKFRDGTLLHDLPSAVQLEHIQRVEPRSVGEAAAAVCSVCDGGIAAGDRLAIRLKYPNGSTFTFHRPCFDVWNQNRKSPTPR